MGPAIREITMMRKPWLTVRLVGFSASNQILYLSQFFCHSAKYIVERVLKHVIAPKTLHEQRRATLPATLFERLGKDLKRRYPTVGTDKIDR
jgi:hypothetical protein